MEEVLQFAKDYIKFPKKRTAEQRIKIRAVYRELTGETVNISCGSCYIEALLKIIKIHKMGHCDYLLKPGAVLQAFGDSSKVATNANLTNEIAKWYLENVPGSERKFSRIPPGITSVPAGITIIQPPAATVIIQPEKIIIPEVKPVEVKAEEVKPVEIKPKTVRQKSRKTRK
jgi:hypothetical protein